MSRNIEIDLDFRRAVFLLKNKITNAADLVNIWSFCGPCSEPCPSIEKIPKK